MPAGASLILINAPDSAVLSQYEEWENQSGFEMQKESIEIFMRDVSSVH